MSNWIVCCIVSEPNIHRRALMFVNFVETAKQCLEFRNYNAVMAIAVAGLNCGPVRRLTGRILSIAFDHMLYWFLS